MKKKLLIISLIILLCCSYSNLIYAKTSTDILSSNFTKDFKPDKKLSDKEEKIATPFTNTIVEVTNKVLGILQVLGGLGLVVSIAIFGFNRLLTADEDFSGNIGISRNGDSNTKKALQIYGRNVLIGEILLFTSTTLVRAVFNIFF